MRTAILITVALMLVATAAVADAKWPVDYVPGTPADVVERVGGEDMANAVAITLDAAGMYSDTGNTCNFMDDYDEVCPYTGSLSPDVVYSWYACADGSLDITLCAGSLYDTKLYVYDGAGALVACNDDFCPSYVSELMAANGEAVPVVMGETYYIVVDGYGGDCGDYTIDITGPQCTTAADESNFSLVKTLY
jgi:hypothetical protein